MTAAMLAMRMLEESTALGKALQSLKIALSITCCTSMDEDKTLAIRSPWSSRAGKKA